MANSDLNSNRKKCFKWRLIALSVLPLIIIVVWLILSVYPHLDRIENVANQTWELAKNFFAEIQKIETIDSKALLGMNILNKEDMQSLKKILFALKAEVDKAIELSHQDTINIVDRVNLYITIGIVLLTLLGVFVPVIVQNIGSQELREKQKELNQRIKDRDEQIDRKYDKIDERINSINIEVLNIPPLRLSYSLLRALDKNLIRWYSKKQKDNRNFLKEIFEIIYKDLETCREKKVLSSRNKDILKGSLRDFNFHLREILFTLNDREHLDHFKKLENTIEGFINNADPKLEETLFCCVIDEVENIKNSF
ncbi:MAG: hypothetical protein PVH61_07640 [Candidatus Aminicenantes bacterium]|jgi:hypothetical protein